MMKTTRSFLSALAMGVAVGAAMTVALEDAGVGIALGAAAFIAFGGAAACRRSGGGAS